MTSLCTFSSLEQLELLARLCSQCGKEENDDAQDAKAS